MSSETVPKSWNHNLVVIVQECTPDVRYDKARRSPVVGRLVLDKLPVKPEPQTFGRVDVVGANVMMPYT